VSHIICSAPDDAEANVNAEFPRQQQSVVKRQTKKVVILKSQFYQLLQEQFSF